MLQQLSLSIIYLLEFLIEYLFFSQISTRKPKFALRITVSFLVFEAAGLVNYMFGNSLVANTVYYFAACLFFALFCYTTPVLQSVFYVTLMYGFSTVSEFGVIFFVTSVLKVNITAYNADPVLMLLMGFLCKTIYFAICVVLVRFAQRKSDSPKLPLSFFVYPVATATSIVMLWVLTLKYEFSFETRIILAAVSFILIMATLTLFLTYQQNIKKENEHTLVKTEYHRLQTEQNYYDILNHQNQQLRIYAHDAKNHLNTIRSLNQNPDIEQYIEQMYTNLCDYSNTVSHSGNKTLDVILGRYKTESDIKNINFSFDVRLSNLSEIDSFDLVAILDNLLDNAFESAVKSDERLVRIETGHRNNYDVIIITNSCNKEPVINKNKIVTTKEDKEEHGFGLKSVMQTIEKYGGDIDWEYEPSNKIFMLTATVHQNAGALPPRRKRRFG